MPSLSRKSSRCTPHAMASSSGSASASGFVLGCGRWPLAFGFLPLALSLSPEPCGRRYPVLNHWPLTLRFGASAVGFWQLAFSPVCICAVWALASSYVFGFFCWVGFGVGFVFVLGSCFNFAFGYGLRPLVFVRWPLGCFVLSPSRSGLRL